MRHQRERARHKRAIKHPSQHAKNTQAHQRRLCEREDELDHIPKADANTQHTSTAETNGQERGWNLRHCISNVERSQQQPDVRVAPSLHPQLRQCHRNANPITVPEQLNNKQNRRDNPTKSAHHCVEKRRNANPKHRKCFQQNYQLT